MQNIISDSIDTEVSYQVIRIDRIASALGDLVLSYQHPWMSEYLLRQRYVQSQQHDRPVNGVESDDVLADQMQISRPVLLIQFAMVAIYIIA